MTQSLESGPANRGLLCPVCSEPLYLQPPTQHSSALSGHPSGHVSLQSKQLRCKNSHCFDQAKQGYFNLLLNKDKSSKTPGDSAEMVQARKRFLENAHYIPIIQACIDALPASFIEMCRGTSRVNYCDIACGEGYYSERIQSLLHEYILNRDGNNDTKSDSIVDPIGAVFKGVEVTGLDISTPAVRSAAKRIKAAKWLVANAFRLPISSSSQHLITHMFSRPCPEEAARVLSDDGILIDVSTGSNHLIELRERLYDSVKQKPTDAADDYAPHLVLNTSTTLQFNFTLQSHAEIADLITMTPHTWRANKDRIDEVKKLEELSLSADIVVKTYSKMGDVYASA